MAKIYYTTDENFDVSKLKELAGNHTILKATCSICGKTAYTILDDTEEANYRKRMTLHRDAGALQNLFPDIPSWIRSGAIDEYSDGFSICPDCNPF